jgi:PAS domain S-box-containing protein
VCLSLGVIVARPERGGMRLFVSKGVGATTARRFVPAAILVPLLFGGLAMVGENLGYYDERYRAAVIVIGMTVALVALLVRHGHAEDATDLARRDAEARVVRSEQRWRAIAEQVTDVITRHRLDGTTVYVSATARSVMGYEPAELIGRSAFDVFVAEDVTLVEQEIGAAAASGRTHLARFRARHKEGRTIWLESTFRVVPSLESPDVPELVAVSRDVTAQVEIERMRREFIAMLSHDLKNPLGVLATYLEVLDEESDDAKRRDLTARMRRNVDDAARLAVNMVDALRIESGSLPVVRVHSSLDAIVRDVLRRQEGGARLKDVVIELRSGEIPMIDLDARLIERALDNLLFNAIKYAPTGSRIEVETRIDGGQACVAVLDHGPGISAQAEATLFQRFQREADLHHDSSGLGLFIVRSIAEAHGGSVVYDSPGGDGARFCIHLPLDEATRPAQPLVASASSSSGPGVVAARRP